MFYYYKYLEDLGMPDDNFAIQKHIRNGNVYVMCDNQVNNENFIEIQEKEFFENIKIEKSKEDLLNDLKIYYLQLIKDADLLGDTEEKVRLQQEYLQKKAEIENG